MKLCAFTVTWEQAYHVEIWGLPVLHAGRKASGRFSLNEATFSIQF